MIKPQNLLPNLSPRQPLEDEYISETDGLIYCSKCHTPRQKKIEFLGKNHVSDHPLPMPAGTI